MRRRVWIVLAATAIHWGISWVVVRQAALRGDMLATAALLACAMASIGTGAALGVAYRHHWRRPARILSVRRQQWLRRAG
jgi:hypothetical protein